MSVLGLLRDFAEVYVKFTTKVRSQRRYAGAPGLRWKHQAARASSACCFRLGPRAAASSRWSWCTSATWRCACRTTCPRGTSSPASKVCCLCDVVASHADNPPARFFCFCSVESVARAVPGADWRAAQGAPSNATRTQNRPQCCALLWQDTLFTVVKGERSHDEEHALGMVCQLALPVACHRASC